MGLLVGSMHEHWICCIVHIILCSLTVWFSVAKRKLIWYQMYFCTFILYTVHVDLWCVTV